MLLSQARRLVRTTLRTILIFAVLINNHDT